MSGRGGTHPQRRLFGLVRQEDRQDFEASLPYKLSPCVREAKEGGPERHKEGCRVVQR